MSHLYILTDPDRHQLGPYKVGISSSDSKGLISQYKRAFPQIKLKFFCEMDNAEEVEREMKKAFYDKRMPTDDGNASEWYKHDFGELVIFATQKAIIKGKKQTEPLEIQNLRFENEKLKSQLNRIRGIADEHIKIEATPVPIVTKQIGIPLTPIITTPLPLPPRTLTMKVTDPPPTPKPMTVNPALIPIVTTPIIIPPVIPTPRLSVIPMPMPKPIIPQPIIPAKPFAMLPIPVQTPARSLPRAYSNLSPTVMIPTT